MVIGRVYLQLLVQQSRNSQIRVIQELLGLQSGLGLRPYGDSDDGG